MRWRMRLIKFDFDVRYKKGLLNTQDDAQFCLRSIEEAAVSVDAEISTYTLHSNVTSNNRDHIDNLDAELAMTSNTSFSFVPITLEEIRLS